MRWTLDELLALPVSYYIALGQMLEEDAQELNRTR